MTALRHIRPLFFNQIKYLSFAMAFIWNCENLQGADPAEQFAIETWMIEHGMPQDSVTAVLQTRAGYIWASTYNGIAQFDGARFKVFDSSNTEGLTNSRITSLYQDVGGDIWIGHDTGDVTRFSKGKFEAMPLPHKWTSNPIAQIASDNTGDVWVAYMRGEAVRVRDGLLVQAPTELAEGPSVAPQLILDPQRRLLMVRNGYVAQITPEGAHLVDMGGKEARPYYSRVARSRQGGLWVSGTGTTHRRVNETWEDDLGAFPWGGASVVTMMESSAGQLLVGTLEAGLFIYDRTAGWMNLNRTNGLHHDWIRCLTEDREHNIWVGTSGGLAVMRPRKVVMYSPPDEWAGRPVHGISWSADGSVWAATEGAGIYHLMGGHWTHFGTSEGLSNLFAWTVMMDSGNKVWAGTWGGGLFRLEGNSFVRQFDLAERGEPVTALLEYPVGTIWIGTAAGLMRCENNKLERLAKLGGAAAGDVRTLEAGLNGELWIGTQGSGLGRLKAGKIQTFQHAEGLPRDFVLSLYQDPDGTLWIGTLDQGLCRYREGRFDSITIKQGLPNSVIGHIADDGLGNLWFNSQKGLFRVGKNDLHRCADGKTASVRPLAYGKAEGLTTVAGTSGFTPSGFRSPDGRLWFPTARGIAVINPAPVQTNQVTPSVWIEDILVDGKRAEIQNQPTETRTRGRGQVTERLVELSPGRRQLEIRFTGISFTSPERVQFKYRLEGMTDANWTESATRGPVTYSFLPPGHYTFHVIACNSDGLWNETGDTVSINVLPHLWQTWWFKAGLGIMGFGIVAGVVYLESRRRLRQKMERLARERELERERARIAQDIHDDLGASLTRIGMLSESATDDLDDRERAAASLGQIYSTARDLTRAMDEIVWAVNPRHDTLESLTNYIARYAHDFLTAAHIRCRLDAPTSVPELVVRSETRHNLFLAFKEALNNAVKHSGASEVRVTLELVTGGFRLVVADNGSGFGPKKPGMSSHRLVSGHGIVGIRKRLEQIGGRVDIESQSGEGVRVELFVPHADATQIELADAESRRD
jgi:signal transduction histidine kinase/ligand-binding sensor domain-containing protein